jgi:hypothetical protein
VKRYISSLLALFLFFLAACNSSPRSDRSFDQIRDLVQGKTASEIEEILGAPDSRKSMALGDERWIWWEYTYLGGQDYSPDVRDKVVHLQITFTNPSIASSFRPSYSEWKILDPKNVSYVLPGGGR